MTHAPISGFSSEVSVPRANQDAIALETVRAYLTITGAGILWLGDQA